MQDMRWDHGLKVTGEGEYLVGHAGAVLLRKLADQAGADRPARVRAGAEGKVPPGRLWCGAGVHGVAAGGAVALRGTAEDCLPR